VCSVPVLTRWQICIAPSCAGKGCAVTCKKRRKSEGKEEGNDRENTGNEQVTTPRF
jgi:hypothetical protein